MTWSGNNVGITFHGSPLCTADINKPTCFSGLVADYIIDHFNSNKSQQQHYRKGDAISVVSMPHGHPLEPR
jgi:hypothetical protein